ESVALLFSADDGASWDLVADDLPNNGSYDWTLPTTHTDRGRVAVVLVEQTVSGDPAVEVTGVLAISDRFIITSPVGVDGGSPEFALHGPISNPSTRLTVSFVLPNAEPASLAAYDVT